MSATVNYVLQKIAGELFIKYDSPERRLIEDRVTNFKFKLRNYFGRDVRESVLFGSYKRDTILPRRYDPNSDVDVLVVFDATTSSFAPDTYRNQLRRFANSEYPTSSVIKDHPSIVLELSGIKFDLVPCKTYNGLFSSSFQIPGKDGSWLDTDPNGFSEALTASNKRFNSIVKPIIRLVKRWNAYENYPYPSFELEKLVAEMYFSGDNYQSGFFYASRNLPKYGLPEYQQRKVETLSNNIGWVEEYLNRDDQMKAAEVINRILGL